MIFCLSIYRHNSQSLVHLIYEQIVQKTITILIFHLTPISIQEMHVANHRLPKKLYRDVKVFFYIEYLTNLTYKYILVFCGQCEAFSSLEVSTISNDAIGRCIHRPMLPFPLLTSNYITKQWANNANQLSGTYHILIYNHKFKRKQFCAKPFSRTEYRQGTNYQRMVS